MADFGRKRLHGSKLLISVRLYALLIGVSDVFVLAPGSLIAVLAVRPSRWPGRRTTCMHNMRGPLLQPTACHAARGFNSARLRVAGPSALQHGIRDLQRFDARVTAAASAGGSGQAFALPRLKGGSSWQLEHFAVSGGRKL